MILTQPYYVECWCEKDALIEVVGRTCAGLDINYFSCRGYTSQSELWQASQRIIAQERDGKTPVILHLGDHDPSGIDMSRDIQDRLSTFGAHIHFQRLALNIEQIEAYNPPPNPAKVTDTRAGGYIKKYGGQSWELDALEPKVIDTLVTDAVLQFRHDRLFSEAINRECVEREILRRLLAACE